MNHTSFRKGIYVLCLLALLLSAITLTDMFGFVLILVTLGTIFAVLLFSIVKQLVRLWSPNSNHQISKNSLLKFLATLMGIFLVTGTIQYLNVFRTIALHSQEITDHVVEFNNAEYLFRSLLCSLNLFTFNLDSNILDRLDEYPTLKAGLSIQAALSFSCTILMLLGLVYSRLKAYYQLVYKTPINNRHNHLYIFFGVNAPSETLIKDIKKNDANAIIILIEDSNIDEGEVNEWNSIISVLTHRHKTIDIVKRNEIRITSAEQRLSNIDKEITSCPDFDAFGHMGLSYIAKLINKLKNISGAELHIFFLDNDEERNIRDIITLAKDKTIQSLSNTNVPHKIYCHARYNGPNRVIKDVAINKKLNIKIVDSSHIAIENIKLIPEFHPVNVVTLDSNNPGTVSGPFNALIVGFGEVGRDAFRFLYEFSAFVDNSATDSDCHRSQFNCTIVDKDLSTIQGSFKASMPGIFDPRNKNAHIIFKEIDYNNDAFYNDVLDKERIKQLNYVIISIGDNDEAISLATRIFNRFRRFGGDLNKLRILVRCTDDAKIELVSKIADHYNYGYGKQKNNTPIIRIFGQPEEVYTFDLVVSNRLIEMGKQFNKNYCTINNGGDLWEERHRKCIEPPVPQIDKLRRMRRQESQDIANALHINTKLTILRNAMGDDTDWQSFWVRYFDYNNKSQKTGSKSQITYTELSERENLIILRLAMLEHIRWNAAHELLGYVRRDDNEACCDETTMRHNCLKDWQELDHESELTESGEWPCDYKGFDFTVVDTTISMNRHKLLSF